MTESVRLLRLSRASANVIIDYENELRGMAVVPCPFVFIKNYIISGFEPIRYKEVIQCY